MVEASERACSGSDELDEKSIDPRGHSRPRHGQAPLCPEELRPPGS
jgi:hypothetical protein